ncbi:MAG TPA: hypothetical protein VEZ72_11670, partial [Paenibacillus sp.]|nr:hypothetical protein [Paenibacillus sp.]
LGEGSPEREKAIATYRELAELLSYTRIETWGIQGALSALHRLQRHGLLNSAVAPETLARYRAKLDWRTFVNAEDLTLIGLPTNYYGVAIGISAYREKLGWDEPGMSGVFMEKLLAHVDRFSGQFGFMDDSKGEGKYDLYSVNAPFEVYGKLVAAGLPVPDRVLEMVRRSLDIYLQLSNTKGHGFSYGRSIGVYGDFIGALAVAAANGLLSDEEMAIAYAYNVASAEKMVRFWIDPETRSLNLWDKGRRTDGYRNKQRILEVNLGVALSLATALEQWSLAGFGESPPAEDIDARLDALPRTRYFPFEQGEYERGLAIVRDGAHVFSLPIVNGATNAYSAPPYLPIPNEHQVLETVPHNVGYPHLVPRLTFADGSEVMPIAYAKRIAPDGAPSADGEWTLVYEQDAGCLLGDVPPRAYAGLRSRSTYRFRPGVWERTDVFESAADTPVEAARIEFATFSEAPVVDGCKVRFGAGPILEIEAVGYDRCETRTVENEREYHTSHGPSKTHVTWTVAPGKAAKRLELGWRLTYR